MQGLIKLGSKEYTVSGLGLGDWESLVHYVKYRPYHILKAEAVDVPELKELLSETLRECSKSNITLETLEDHLSNPDTLIEVLYYSMRKVHQAITREEIRNSVSINDLKPAMELVMSLSVPEASGEAKKNETQNP